MQERFRKFVKTTTKAIGSPWAFTFAAILVFLWISIGLYFHFSSFIQSVFSLIATSITFILLFIIQHQQNRDSTAINLKLDELILASKHARNKVIDAENLPDVDLKEHKEDLVKHIEEESHIVKKHKK